MRKLLLLILLGITFSTRAQIATGVNNLQAFPWRTFSNPNVVGLVYDGSQYRMYGFDKYALLDTTNATGKFGTKYDISLKTNRSQTLSINGTTYDLSDNRSWTVGDIMSTGSYGNPSWITSLAWSKITGAPIIYSFTGTTSQYTRGDGSYATFPTEVSSFANDANYVTSSSLSSTLASYATTSALTSGLGTKQNTLTLTNTGTGAATLIGSTLNIPTPSIPAQYNPNAGTGIAITGTYPNQTITNTSPDYIPTPNSATRALNSNFTISSTKQAQVAYTISLSVTNPLLAGVSTAAAYLEYSINAGNAWVSVSDALISSGVGVAVAVAITNTQSQIVSGVIPANALVRIRTTTSGTASLVFVRGQETY